MRRQKLGNRKGRRPAFFPSLRHEIFPRNHLGKNRRHGKKNSAFPPRRAAAQKSAQHRADEKQGFPLRRSRGCLFG